MRFSQITNKIKLLKINLTDAQLKIIIIFSSVLFIFLLFWVFLFLPASKQIATIKKELILTDQQIQGIEMLLAGSQSRDEAIRLLKKKQQYLSNKFPQEEEESLRFISEIARKMNIDVISMQPGSRTELLDDAGKQIVIESKVANYLPVTLEISCHFKDLVRYTLELKAALPALTSVNSLKIKKEDQLTGKIRATIEFNLYLLN